MKKQRGEATIILLMAVMAITSALPYFKVPEARCWFGYLHNSMSGGQVIGKDGGGVPCTVIEDSKKEPTA